MEEKISLEECTKEILRKVRDVEGILGEIKHWENIEIKDEHLRENFQNFVRIVKEGIERLNKEAEFLENNMEWNTFNVAFFGETNAGKSTIVEALIQGDGRNIGEGQKDFTKRIKKFPMKDIVLLDMPGIEGNERKVIHEIKKAIDKAHIIFYVMSDEKVPEEGTVRKIRNYLKDRATVYSVINIKNKPSAYAYCGLKLIDDRIITVENGVKRKFRKIFGNYYKDNICMNAYIGFISAGRPKRAEFIKDREKAKKIFGSLEEAYKFSKLDELKDVILQLATSGKYHAMISNALKLTNVLERIISSMFREKKKYDAGLKEIRSQANEMFRSIMNEIKMEEEHLFKKADVIIGKMESEMRKCAYKAIEEKTSEDALERKLQRIKRKYSKELKKEVEERVERIKEKAKKRMKELEARVKLSFKTFTLSEGLGMEIFKDLEKNIMDVIKKIVENFVLSIIILIADPLVGAVYLLMGVIKFIVDIFLSSKEKKRKAKQKARRKIKSALMKAKKDMYKKIKGDFKKIKNCIVSQKRKFLEYINKLFALGKEVQENIERLVSAKTLIFSIASRYVLGDNVYVYFDNSFGRMVIIGDKVKRERLSLFPVPQDRIEIYQSFQDFLNNIKYEINDGILLLSGEDEFKWRAVKALYPYMDMKIEKVRKYQEVKK